MDGCEILVTAEQIEARIEELARQISREYRGKNPLLITLLKGAFVFLADLVRRLSIPHEIDFITLSSYRDGSNRSSIVEISDNLKIDPRDRDVIIIDEIVDTGHTLSRLIRTLDNRNVRSVKICTLLDKPSAREIDVTVHYTGFTIPDVFVVGYGLDYREQFRNLPYICKLSRNLERQAVSAGPDAIPLK